MTDVFDRVRAANPVPDPDRYYESLSGRSEPLLSSNRDRRDHMTVEEITRLEVPAPETGRSAHQGWRIAVAAAIAVVALVAGFVVVGGGGQDTAGLTDVEVAEQFLASLETGDVVGYEALVDSGAVAGGGLFFGPPSAQWAYVSRFQAATGGTYTAECEETPGSPSVDVVCAVGEMNRFREAAGADPNRYDWSFAMEDGTITLMNFGGDLILPVFKQVIAYDEWLQANYPTEYASLMGIPDFLLEFEGAETESLLPMPIVDTAEQRTRHDVLTAEWLASLTQ
jgi:hypothetical protein